MSCLTPLTTLVICIPISVVPVWPPDCMHTGNPHYVAQLLLSLKGILFLDLLLVSQLASVVLLLRQGHGSVEPYAALVWWCSIQGANIVAGLLLHVSAGGGGTVNHKPTTVLLSSRLVCASVRMACNQVCIVCSPMEQKYSCWYLLLLIHRSSSWCVFSLVCASLRNLSTTV
jgi:hypothetical protein